MLSAPPRPEIPTLASLPNVIDTPRLKLRPLQMTDVDALGPYVGDPNVARYMSWAAHQNRAETEQFVKTVVDGFANNTGMVWAIEIDGAARGLIALDGIRWTFRAW